MDRRRRRHEDRHHHPLVHAQGGAVPRAPRQGHPEPPKRGAALRRRSRSSTSLEDRRVEGRAAQGPRARRRPASPARSSRPSTPPSSPPSTARTSAPSPRPRRHPRLHGGRRPVPGALRAHGVPESRCASSRNPRGHGRRRSTRRTGLVWDLANEKKIQDCDRAHLRAREPGRRALQHGDRRPLQGPRAATPIEILKWKEIYQASRTPATSARTTPTSSATSSSRTPEAGPALADVLHRHRLHHPRRPRLRLPERLPRRRELHRHRGLDPRPLAPEGRALGRVLQLRGRLRPRHRTWPRPWARG